MPDTIKLTDMLSTSSFKIGGKEFLLCKQTSHKWHVTDSKGVVLHTSKTKGSSMMKLDRLIEDAKAATVKSKKTTPAKGGSKPAGSGVAVNYFGFSYGSKISASAVKGYCKEVWGGLLTLSNVEFDSHYWRGTVRNKDGATVENARLDYVISYMRCPAKLQTEIIQKHRRAVVEKLQGAS